MPTRARRECTKPGCSTLVSSGACDDHRHQAEALDRSRRGSASARFYGRSWQKARDAFLRVHPFCEMECAEAGVVSAAEVVDHITPHRGDLRLFWDRANWQPGCKPCHDRKTAREDGGFGRPRAEGEGGVNL